MKNKILTKYQMENKGCKWMTIITVLDLMMFDKYLIKVIIALDHDLLPIM